MAKLCKSGRFAVLQEVPHGSKYQHLVGTIGVLEVWESEQSYPGKYGALFYFPFVIDRKRGKASQRYLKTSFSYDIYEYSGLIMFKRGENQYTFEFTDDSRVSTTFTTMDKRPFSIFTNPTPMGSIWPPQLLERSPGWLSIGRLVRQFGQWFFVFLNRQQKR